LFKITILLGIVGMVAVLHTTKKSMFRDGSMIFAALIIMYLFSLDGFVSKVEGIILILIYIGYLIYLSKVEKIKNHSQIRKENPLLDLLVIAIGIAIIIYAAKFVVENGVIIAEELNIIGAFIGIFIGIGTSLPELSVSLKAVIKQSHHLSLGNIIGSNITDPLLSFGSGAAISGFVVGKTALIYYFPFWIFATLIALLMLFNHMNLNKKEGAVLVLIYLLFMYLSFVVLQ